MLIIGGRRVGTIGFGTAQLAFTEVSFDQAVGTFRAALDGGTDGERCPQEYRSEPCASRHR
jgi:hypothetical protein